MRFASRNGIGFGPISWATLAGFVLLVLAAGSMLSDYDRFLATSAVIMALMVQGLGVVTGRAGMIVLAQLGFAAVGAFAFLFLRIHVSGLGFVGAVVGSGIVTAAVGALVGLPALRLRGVNLGIVTLVFGVTVNVILATEGFPGQSEAFFADRPGWLTEDSAYFYFCGAVFAITSVSLAIVDRSRIGASWLAVRGSERATAALGRSVPFTKMTAFGTGAFIAGLAGALFVGQQGTVTVESFSPLESLILFALAIMLGGRYAEGALLAGVVSVFMPVLFDNVGVSQNVPNLLFAVGAVLGLLHGRGAAEDIRFRLGRRFGRPLPELAVVEGEAVVTPPSPPSSSDSPALEIEGLTVSYGKVKALENVSLTVPVGSVTAVIGPNGAGKSTLIDSVTGFVRGYEGQVRVGGESVDALVPHQRARLGLRRSFQQDRTIAELTVEQYLRLSMSREVNAATSDEELTSMLAFFAGPHPSRRLRTVDVGSRRIVEVVAAIAARPRVVLLDEPAAGLAATESLLLAEQIAAIPERFGPSVLLVEHDMELVQAACDSLVVLDFGKVIAAGEPKAVLADPIVAKAYLGQELVV